jgi:hypothetical protein
MKAVSFSGTMHMLANVRSNSIFYVISFCYNNIRESLSGTWKPIYFSRNFCNSNQGMRRESGESSLLLKPLTSKSLLTLQPTAPHCTYMELCSFEITTDSVFVNIPRGI